MKHLVLLLTVLLLATSLSLGQQPTLTRLATIAGDSTIAMVNRGGIEYLSSGVIWIAVGDYPHTGKNNAYLSTDNGATWVKRPITTNAAIGSPGNVTGFAAKDANIALAGLGTGEILRTTNGGVKWDTVTFYTDGFIDGIRFVSGDTVIAYGDDVGTGVYVARSFDAGKTWTRVPNVNSSLPGDSLNALGTASGGSIYAGYASYGNGMETFGRNVWLTLYNTSNDPPSILKSTDAGATWSWFRVTLPGGAALNYYIRSITFKDANVGFAVCKRAYVNAASNDNYLIKTTDGGRTWSDTISVEPGKGHADSKPMTVRAIRGTNTVIAVGTPTAGSKSWISNDNGLTWAPMTTPSPNATCDLRNVVFASATQGMMIGYYNLVKVSIATAVEKPTGAVPTAYTLYQNYPNPFNPTTTISYSLPKSSFVDLRIYDLLGKNVATLVQTEQSAGTHSAVFDAKGLASGVYVYTLKAGDFTATKSLILVK